MSHELVSRNDDIQRLVAKGYAVAFDDNHYLVVRDIPYLDAACQCRIGAIVTKFVDMGGDRIAQEDHQVFFAGGVPHGLDAQPIPNLGGGPTSLALGGSSSDIKVERSFSNRPPQTGKFNDFYDKIENYVNIISGPAIERQAISPLTFRVVGPGSQSSPFKIRDTLTSRAEIGDLNDKFKDDVVAVIGVGGTGGFVLDLLAKTPVREIRGFDADDYHVHNVFRSPGPFEDADLGKSKAEVFQSRYENLRTGISVIKKFIDATCAQDFQNVTFAFVCIDKGSSRAEIFELLIALGIPFIDVGMGLHRREGALTGMLRTTYYSVENALDQREKGWAELTDQPNDLYRTNIQIGELNALNACLAVLRFKQLRGFYFDEHSHKHLLFQVSSIKIISDE